MIQIDIPAIGLTLTNDLFDDLVDLVSFSGWYSSPENRFDIEDIPDGDGGFDEDPIFKRPRFVSIGGQKLQFDPTAAFELQRSVMSLQALGTKFDVIVTDPLGTLTVSCRVGGSIACEIVDEKHLVTFDIPVTVPDPRKYGPVVSVSSGLPVPGTGFLFPATFPADFGLPGNSGRLSVTNTGTANTYPLFLISGGSMSEGFEVARVGGAERLRLERPIPEGSTVSLNSRTGRVQLDGSDITAFLTRDDWFAVAAGSSITLQFSAIGDVEGEPRLTVQAQPAFY